jgi:hypothetical protein
MQRCWIPRIRGRLHQQDNKCGRNWIHPCFVFDSQTGVWCFSLFSSVPPLICWVSTGCNKIKYTTLKLYCDQINSNITKHFLTEHLLTLQHFLRVFNMAASGYASDTGRYSNSSHSLSKKVTPIRAMALIRISYGCLPHNQWKPYWTLLQKFEVLTNVLQETVLLYYYSFGHDKFSKLYTLFCYTLYIKYTTAASTDVFSNSSLKSATHSVL